MAMVKLSADLFFDLVKIINKRLKVHLISFIRIYLLYLFKYEILLWYFIFYIIIIIPARAHLLFFILIAHFLSYINLYSRLRI
jgi:hypothetical protein